LGATGRSQHVDDDLRPFGITRNGLLENWDVNMSVRATDPWTVGIRVGPYELIERIGAGGMGEVWKARDSRLDRIVAMKRLQAPHAVRFEQEARAIA
jgi:serine/threonine protein kinase